MTQEFHLSITPIRNNEYLVRTEQVAPGVPLAEEQVTWQVDDWLTEASLLMGDPLLGLLRSGAPSSSAFNFNGASGSLHSTTPPANLVAFGQRLYNALFQGTIRDSWMMAQGIAQHQHQRLRFRLGLKSTKLHRLPWEVLYAGDRPLATGTDVIFSRYHSSFSVLKSHVSFQRNTTVSANQPLKILMVLSAPSDQEVLALKQEAEHLKQELQTPSQATSGAFSEIELTILEQPGREQLTQALEHQHYQILHYAGHSDLGASGGSLYLVSSRTGLTEVLSGEDLAGLLVNNGVRMAVFNSCRGVYMATSEANSAEGNLAEALVRRGIPAVLAMAEQIPDDVALNLSRLFYRNLKQAYSVDLSLSRTRQGLISSYGSNQLYWALPILYLHPEFDGVLRPLSHAAEAAISNPNSVNSGLYSAPTFERSPEAETVSFMDGRSPSVWQPDHRVSAYAHPTDDEPEYTPDFDELEFDDPDPPEEEQIAQLVYEVSHSPTILETDEPLLLASPGEDLLPPKESENGRKGFFSRPAPHKTAPNKANSSQKNASSPQAGSPPHIPSGDTKVFSELEAVLANMGTLTPEIAASNRAVQTNPNSAEAYTHLGWALYQKGYLTEAISAYNQAIRLDSTHAEAFNRLGLAFYQQGKVEEAIRAYNRAVQLDSTLTEASTNLRDVLYGPNGEPTTESVSSVSSSPKSAIPRSQISKPRWQARQIFLWSTLGTAIAALVAGVWFYRGDLLKELPSLPDWFTPGSVDRSSNFEQQDSAAIATLATQQLQQGNTATAQSAIEELIERKKLVEADTILQTASSQYANDPTLNFLKGRIIWHRWLAGEANASINSVRQLWEQAAQAQPTAKNQNALGFAYYAQGEVERAEQTWLKALQAPGTDKTPAQEQATQGSYTADALTSYAGLALTAMKLAEKRPLGEQAVLRSEAQKRRDLVLQNDPVNFRPEKLNQNWMWSEKAIQDWRSLLALK